MPRCLAWCPLCRCQRQRCRDLGTCSTYTAGDTAAYGCPVLSLAQYCPRDEYWGAPSIAPGKNTGELLKARLKVLLKVLIRLLKARLKVLLKVLIRLLKARLKVLLKVLIRGTECSIVEGSFQGINCRKPTALPSNSSQSALNHLRSR